MKSDLILKILLILRIPVQTRAYHQLIQVATYPRSYPVPADRLTAT